MNNITFTASPMSKPNDLSLKASLAWDYYKFNVDERNWFCVETGDGGIIVTDETRNLSDAFVFSGYDSFLEWLESDATDKLEEDPAEYFRDCGVVPDNLLSDSVVQALLATINAPDKPTVSPVSAEEKPSVTAPRSPETILKGFYVTFRVNGLYTIWVEATDPETAKATAQEVFDAEDSNFNDHLKRVSGEVAFLKDERGNLYDLSKN